MARMALPRLIVPYAGSGELGYCLGGLPTPWTQPRQAKKNSESEPPVEANITIVIFRVRLALGIFRVWGGNPAGTRTSGVLSSWLLLL